MEIYGSQREIVDFFVELISDLYTACPFLPAPWESDLYKEVGFINSAVL